MDMNQQRRQQQRAKKAKQRRNRRILTCTLFLIIIVLMTVLIVRSCNKAEDTTDKKSAATTQNTEKSTEAPDTGDKKVVAKANILSTGDILIHKMVLDSSAVSGGYDFTPHFNKIKSKISDADLAVANFEITLGGKDKGYSCYPCFNTPDSIGTALKDAGFDFLVTANNHCYDTGFSGIKRTVNTLADQGFKTTGTRSSLDQKKYSVVDVNGIKIGIVNYTFETNTDKAGRKALNGILMDAEANDYVNSFNEKNLSGFYSEMAKNIKDMKSDGAEAIVLYIHWGVEYQLSPNEQQKQIAQKMCDLGVDAIIGGHPHVLQSAAVLTSKESGKTTFCLYSDGNALSNQRIQYMGTYGDGHTEDGILVYTQFTKYSDGTVKLTSVDYTPTWVNLYSKGGKNVYEITALDDMNSVTTNKDAAQKSLDRTKAIVDEGFKAYNAAVA